MGKTAYFVGPLAASAIVDATGTINAAFYYCFAVGVLAAAWLILGVDLSKSQLEQVRFLTAEALAREKLSVQVSEPR